MCGMGIITSSEDILISAMSSKQAQVKLQHCVGSLDRFEEFRQGKKGIEEQEVNEKIVDDANGELVYEIDEDYDKSEKERVGKINIMIFKVNIDKLFREIEEKVIEEQRNIGEKSLEEEEELEKNYTIEEIQEEVVKNNDQEEKMEYEKEDKSLESPEDAKETQEVP